MSTEFDRKAAAWVRKHYPDSNPIVGSVTFETDFAAYASGAWARFNVEWSDEIRHNGGLRGERSRCESISEEAWNYDASDLMRELVEMEDPGE